MILSAADSPGRPVRVRRLLLRDFRSYGTLELRTRAERIVLAGPNGAGKTNILEALSLMAPGRGLRRADAADLARSGGSGGWSVSVEIEDAAGSTQLGFGVAAPSGGGTPAVRRNRVNGVAVSSSLAFAEYVRLVWLVPEMDLLFLGPPLDRRRFLDRTVQALDPGHASRLASLERAARSRNRLLQSAQPDSAWLDSIEREIAELSLAVAAARAHAAERLDHALKTRKPSGDFPWGEATLSGDLEDWVRAMPALEAEERHRRHLRENRSRDAAAGRTGAGLRSADLLVAHGPGGRPASLCSTGEQKALLVGLLLAQAQIVADETGLAPIVLLDEAAAHFDPGRRAALYADISSIGSQVWLTGADAADFAELAGGAEVFEVESGAARADAAMDSPAPRRPGGLEIR